MLVYIRFDLYELNLLYVSTTLYTFLSHCVLFLWLYSLSLAELPHTKHSLITSDTEFSFVMVVLVRLFFSKVNQYAFFSIHYHFTSVVKGVKCQVGFDQNVSLLKTKIAPVNIFDFKWIILTLLTFK